MGRSSPNFCTHGTLLQSSVCRLPRARPPAHLHACSPMHRCLSSRNVHTQARRCQIPQGPSHTHMLQHACRCFASAVRPQSPVMMTTFAPQAALQVCRGAVDTALAIVRPPGHHAECDRAMGFCFFNNVVVAAQAALMEPGGWGGGPCQRPFLSSNQPPVCMRVCCNNPTCGTTALTELALGQLSGGR